MATNSFPSPELRFDIEREAPETIVRAKGRLTSETSNVLHDAFRSLIAPGTKSIVLDISEVSYIDSAGLGALLGVYISAQRAGCELQISNPSPRTKDLFHMTKLSSIFKGL